MQDKEHYFSKFVLDRNLNNPDESINLKQNNFKLAFGNLRKDLPLNVGRLNTYYIQRKMVDGQWTKTKEQLNYQRCNLDDSVFPTLDNLHCL